MWIVAFRDGEGTPYGPLPSQPTAERFAAFVTAEVDPASAEWVEVSEEPNTLSSPVRALLDWRDHVARPDKAKPGVSAELQRLIRQAISDPGAFLPRAELESVPQWSMRAVVSVLGREVVDA